MSSPDTFLVEGQGTVQAGQSYELAVKVHYLAGELYDWITDPWGFEKLFHWSRERTTVKLVRTTGPPCSVALDVGCGTGLITRWLPANTVVGMDINRWNVARAKARIPEADFVQCDAESLPFRPGTVDLAVCTEVLEHLLVPATVLSEVSCVMKPGARLIGSVPSDSFLWKLRRFLSVTHPKSEPFHRNYSRQSFFTLLSGKFSQARVFRRNFSMNLFFVTRKSPDPEVPPMTRTLIEPSGRDDVV